MKSATNRIYRLSLYKLLIAGLSILALCSPAALAQTPQQEQKGDKAVRERVTSDQNQEGERQITDKERKTLRREDSSEAEAAILPYINNFFETTRLGPEDVISVDVFDQPVYSRQNITIPPNGRINYPLIGRIQVVGRTTDEIEKDITQKLAEYIIDPKVTVQIVQVHSLKFMVVGDVAVPGIYDMTRRMSVIEGLAKAGYVTRYGNRTNISVLRLQPDGTALPIKVNMREIEKGGAKDIFLAPGDTIVVPGNIFKTIDQVVGLATIAAWMRVAVR